MILLWVLVIAAVALSAAAFGVTMAGEAQALDAAIQCAQSTDGYDCQLAAGTTLRIRAPHPTTAAYPAGPGTSVRGDVVLSSSANGSLRLAISSGQHISETEMSGSTFEVRPDGSAVLLDRAIVQPSQTDSGAKVVWSIGGSSES
jgi:hypothetical protein